MVLSAAIDWATKYSAIYSWVFGASDWATRWADQNAPRPDYPYLLLDVISDTGLGGVPEISKSIDLTRVRNIRVTPTAANNTLYRVTINGTDFDFTSDADATVAEICAGLTAAIGAGAEPVGATDNGTSVDIVGNGEALNPGTPRLFNVTTTGPLTWANNDTGNEVAMRTSRMVEFVLNVQGFHRNTDSDYPATDPGRNAYNMLSTLRASLGLPSVQATLSAADIAIVAEQDIQDLSEVTEDGMISRATLDVRFRTLSVLTEYTGYIATVSGEATYDDAGTPITDSYSVTT